jgi:hypothetical protein
MGKPFEQGASCVQSKLRILERAGDVAAGTELIPVKIKMAKVACQ